MVAIEMSCEARAFQDEGVILGSLSTEGIIRRIRTSSLGVAAEDTSSVQASNTTARQGGVLVYLEQEATREVVLGPLISAGPGDRLGGRV